MEHLFPITLEIVSSPLPNSQPRITPHVLYFRLLFKFFVSPLILNIELGFFDYPGNGAEIVVGRDWGSYFFLMKNTSGEARLWNNGQKLRIQGEPLSKTSGEQRHPWLWCWVDETLIFLTIALGYDVVNYLKKVSGIQSIALITVYLQNRVHIYGYIFRIWADMLEYENSRRD